MKWRLIFGFALLVLAVISIFVGLPYFLKIVKSNQFLKISFPQYAARTTNIATTTTGYYSQTQQSAPKISMNVYRYGKKQISLAASFGNGSVDITGWRIRSFQKGEMVIGKGYALPQIDASVSNVLLGSGESADIFMGPSPLSGNFRINNCFGWLSSVYNLDYSFNYCPIFETKDLIGLNSSCQDLILRTYSCKAPSNDVLNQESSQCRQWVEKNMNYDSCVAKHHNDSDFYKGWKIYTGNNNPIIDSLHDKVELYNQSGILIDSYEY